MVIYKCDICGEETIFATKVTRPEWFGSRRIVICDDCKYAMQGIIGHNFGDPDFLLKILRDIIPKRVSKDML